MASWFDGLHADGGGLVIPGAPAGKAADAQVAADGLHLAAGGATASLAWDLCDRPIGDADWWGVSGWLGSPGDEQGVALIVVGACDQAVDAVRRAAYTPGNRFLAVFTRRSSLVPLDTGTFSVAAAERATFSALCTLLAHRPECRARLSDPAVAGRLAADMRARPQPVKTWGMELRHSTADVHAAMRELGFEHPVENRPIEGEAVPTADEVVPKVLEHLHGKVDQKRADELVRHNFVDVEPWPFAALM